MSQVNKILIVEDDEADLEYIQEYLSGSDVKEKFEVEFESDAAVRVSDALELLEKNVYDLILLDLSLPDSTGLDTLRTVHEKKPEIPIVILTGLNDMDVSFQALEQGATHYFVKGFIDRDELTRNIKTVIENYHNRRKFGV